MAQTLEQINALRRVRGEELLTELPPSSDIPPATPTEAPATPDNNAATPPKQPEAVVEPSITDDLVLKYLQGKGLSVNSLDDLNKPVTEDDLARHADARENAKLTYGLDKGLFNRKTHEQFILDKSKKQDLVYAQYYQDAKKEDAELTDEDIQNEFATKYGLDAEPNTRRHKRGVQEIEILADIILKNKYQNIYKLDPEFEAHERQTNAQKAFERKLLSEAPAYKATVDEVFDSLKKIPTKFSDEESYEVEVVDEAITTLKQQFLNKDFVADQISKGYTKEDLKEVAFTALLRQNWPIIAKEMINQALLRHQKGVKGIIPTGGQQKQDGNDGYSDQQRAVFQRLGLVPQNQPAN